MDTTKNTIYKLLRKFTFFSSNFEYLHFPEYLLVFFNTGVWGLGVTGANDAFFEKTKRNAIGKLGERY